jgi:hypothetical protein
MVNFVGIINEYINPKCREESTLKSISLSVSQLPFEPGTKECCPLLLRPPCWTVCAAPSQCLVCTVAVMATIHQETGRTRIEPKKWRQIGHENDHVSRHILSVMTTLSVEIDNKAVRGYERIITLFRHVNVSGAQAPVWGCGLVNKITYHQIGLRDHFAINVV